ncbi:MAG: symmetrical bis(5'-nucleosyl)-tetraphosphatase [Methylococcales bacterium]
MTTYAIGSVKGDYQSLTELLAKIRFDPSNDRLWFTGNLVNGGSESLEVLRFVKSLGKSAVTVLGNEELHLLTVAAGVEKLKADDTLNNILEAPDRDDLLKWLRGQSLIHHDSKLNFTIVHAGIPAEWSFSQALTFAYEVESVLGQSNNLALFENREYSQSRWHAKLRGWKRLSFIINACTLMSYCDETGKLVFNHHDDETGKLLEGLVPWYKLPDRNTTQLNIIFSDDANFGDITFPGIYPLSADRLSALKLTDHPQRI